MRDDDKFPGRTAARFGAKIAAHGRDVRLKDLRTGELTDLPAAQVLPRVGAA
jgi:hypothetical protein